MRKIAISGLIALGVMGAATAAMAGEITGKVTFSSGSPCSGCEVYLNMDGSNNKTTTTDSGGNYSVSTSSCTVGVEAHVRGTKVYGRTTVDSCPSARINLTAR